MNLEAWLKENEMESSKLAEIIGVSRTVIWKVKKGRTVDEDTARKIRFVTGGKINPEFKPVGRPKKKK